jgi:hypothetical protein
MEYKAFSFVKGMAGVLSRGDGRRKQIIWRRMRDKIKVSIQHRLISELNWMNNFTRSYRSGGGIIDYSAAV